MRREQKLPSELAARFRLLAEIFVTALSRRKAERELCLAELKYRTVADFAQGLLEAPLTGKGFSIVAVDASAHIAVIEAAVPLVAVRDRDRPFVYSTNLYASEALKDADLRNPEQKAVASYRYGYLRWVEQTHPPANLAELQALLGCHDPWAPCRHGGPHGSRTEWSMIGIPAERRFLLSEGAPCEAPYRTYSVVA